MKHEVEFFFDYSSPYTYLASTQIKGLSARTGVTVRWRPLVLGAVFEATDNKPNISVKRKGDYMMVDVTRWSKVYDIALKMPTIFPVKTITALRMALAAEEKGAIVAFSTSVFSAYWSDGVDISADAELVKIATKGELDGEALLKRAREQEIKDRLRANTDEAIKRGAFGAPTFFVGEEMFWGNDRLEIMERYLKGKL